MMHNLVSSQIIILQKQKSYLYHDIQL
jgi:hypothetical protein